MHVQFIALKAKPNDTVALGDGGLAWTTPINMTIVSVSCRPTANDASATIDIQDDGTDVITAIACSSATVPGTWLSTHVGGTNAAVTIAADSVINVDFNSHAVGVGNDVVIGYLPGVSNDS